MHTRGDPVKQNKGKFASQTCVTSGLSNGVPSEHLRKHGSVLCRISVAYSAAMQDRKPELCPHVSGHIAMHLASHLQIYHREVILGRFWAPQSPSTSERQQQECPCRESWP